MTRAVSIPVGRVLLEGNLCIPDGAGGLVLFAHGSGSGRHSPRNRFVASQLNEAGLGTLLMDLLTRDEEAVDDMTRELRFNITFLAERLLGATDWCLEQRDLASLPIGYFGASTGAAAALIGAAERPDIAHAVVSRGGRPDLAERALARVKAPTLFIVGEDDVPVVELNEEAFEQCAAAEKKIALIPGATHLFEEAGALEKVAELASGWFEKFLTAARGPLRAMGR